MLEKFHWKAEDGTEIVLPRMDQIPAGVLRRHRKGEMIDLVFSLLEETADEENLAKVDALPIGQLNKMFEDWQEGVELGESSGSST